MGAAHHLKQATATVYEMLNAGLDPAAPLFSTDGVPYGLVPSRIVAGFRRSVVKALG